MVLRWRIECERTFGRVVADADESGDLAQTQLRVFGPQGFDRYPIFHCNHLSVPPGWRRHTELFQGEVYANMTGKGGQFSSGILGNIQAEKTLQKPSFSQRTKYLQMVSRSDLGFVRASAKQKVKDESSDQVPAGWL